MIVPLEIPVDPTLSPRRQVEAAIATLRPYYCETHSKVLLKPDIEATIRDAFEPIVLLLDNEEPDGTPFVNTQEAPPKQHMRFTFITSDVLDALGTRGNDPTAANGEVGAAFTCLRSAFLMSTNMAYRSP